MTRCPSCARDLAAPSRTCPWCSAPLDTTSAETVAAAVGASSPISRTSRPPSSSSVDEGRFPPGTVLAGRYRIAGLLGRGGMGEVYRATDLVLGQAVALKFLPESMSRDDRALVRFYNEVRIARQVTHPNVCRVHDIGEVDGLHYICMEFVDGEDLASLLRRIGRLPADKAVDTARHLCAGLAAAHEKGVLHRDLKPANVMIDGRGQVIIMDFGLAGLTAELQADIRSGTPAYMSPEQLSGAEVTQKSDIYALGLLLYEIFTGKRAYDAASLVELMRMQEQASPASISSVARDLDPAVERVVLRCLQPDPKLRPPSALSVAAALPGGDPLAAALAAGETPSPGLVAAAGETEGLQPRIAMACLAAAVIGILIVTIWGAQVGVVQKVPIEIPLDGMAQQARTMLKDFGYDSKPADRASGFTYNGEVRTYLNQRKSPAFWKNPPANAPYIVFWYRESPGSLVASRDFSVTPDFNDPPMENSGMLRVRTDTAGRLVRFDAVPPQVEDPAQKPPFDWAILFRAAGLDPSAFQPTEPKWTPLANWDARAAWIGKPANSEELRVEAAQWRGKPVSFRVIGPWTRAERMSPGGDPPSVFNLILIYSGLIVCGIMAARNVRAGKADLNGANKLAILYGGCMFSAAFLQAHHYATNSELAIFWKSVSIALINGMAVWGIYLALEPWIRRRWPHAMIAWTRFTIKGIRDPLVGRDLLAAAGLACVPALLNLLRPYINSQPLTTDLAALNGIRFGITSGLTAATNSIFNTLFYFFILFVARVLLRKVWLANIAFVVLVTFLFSANASTYWELPVLAATATFTMFVLMRFGLFTMIVTNTLSTYLLAWPRTLDGSQWYFSLGFAPIVVVALVALYGFRTSLAGRPLLPPNPS